MKEAKQTNENLINDIIQHHKRTEQQKKKWENDLKSLTEKLNRTDKDGIQEKTFENKKLMHYNSELKAQVNKITSERDTLC